MPPPNLMQVPLIQRKACPPLPLEGDRQTLTVTVLFLNDISSSVTIPF